MDNVLEQDEVKKSHDCLMVLSMHRSGGSLLAKCLHHLGINFGKNLLFGDQTYGDEVFANQDVVLLHEILFRDLGCRWDMVGSLPDGWLESEAAQRAEEKLTTLIKEQLMDGRSWAVRDPRLCRFMPLWKRVFTTLGVKPKFIHLIRHPHEVASSLRHHYKASTDKGHLLWLVYNRDALQAIGGNPHFSLTYDQILADPVSAMLRIKDALDIELPSDPIEHSRTLTEFARPELKHHHTASDETSFSQYAWVYEQFRLDQVKAIEANTGQAVHTSGDLLSDFPIVSTPGTTVKNRKARSHAVAMFNNLLSVIGRYEQDEMDQNLQRERRLLSATHAAETLFAQLYYPDCDENRELYSDENSIKSLLAPAEWQSISWDIHRPRDLRTGRLRLDPLNTRGAVSISSIQLLDVVDGEIYWAADNQEQFKQCSIEGDGLVLSIDQGLTMICTGNDARLRLPLLPNLPDSPMQLKVWIKASRDQAILEETWKRINDEKTELDHKLKEKTIASEQAIKNTRQFEEQIERLHQEQDKNKQEAGARIDALQAKIRALSANEEKLSQSQLAFEKAKADAEALKNELREKTADITTLRQELQKQNSLHTERITQFEKQVQFQINLARQYQEALQDTENEHQQQLENLRMQLIKKQEALKDSENRLQYQEHLSAEYHSALQSAEYEHQTLLKGETEQLVNGMKKLHNAFNALLGSRRWKFGNKVGRVLQIALMRSKRPTAADQIKDILTRFSKTDWTSGALTNRTEETYVENGELLFSWINDLECDFQAFIHSHRWKWGNAAVRFAEIILLRKKVLLAVEHMADIFNAFEHWRQNILTNRAKANWDYQQVNQLRNWLRELDQDFQATLASRRWRVGNAMVQLCMHLTLRPRRALVTDHMQKIFSDYRQQFKG